MVNPKEPALNPKIAVPDSSTTVLATFRLFLYLAQEKLTPSSLVTRSLGLQPLLCQMQSGWSFCSCMSMDANL
jgi:hypothetical protein